MGSKIDEANEWISKAEKRLEIAELHFKLGSYFHCAKNYETASTVYKDLKEYDRMINLISQAGELLQKAGVPDSASFVYERAAKSLEQPMPEEAAKFYQCAAESDEIEDKFHEAADLINNAARLWVRLRRFPEAERALRVYIDYARRANPNSVGATLGCVADSSAVPKLCARAVLVMILIKLHIGDEIAAGKIYAEAVERWRFNETDDYMEARRLLAAVEAGDSESARKAVKLPCFRTLDLDYARLLPEINFPQLEESEAKESESASNVKTSVINKSQRVQQPQPTTASTEPVTCADEVEEEEEDIC